MQTQTKELVEEVSQCVRTYSGVGCFDSCQAEHLITPLYQEIENLQNENTELYEEIQYLHQQLENQKIEIAQLEDLRTSIQYLQEQNDYLEENNQYRNYGYERM